MPLPPIPLKKMGESIIRAALLGRRARGKRGGVAKRRDEVSEGRFTAAAGRNPVSAILADFW